MTTAIEPTLAEKQARKAALEGTIFHLKSMLEYEREQVGVCANYKSMLGPPVSRENEQEYLRHCEWQDLHAWTARLLQSQIDDLEGELHECLPWNRGRCPRCRARLYPSTSEILHEKYRDELCDSCVRETF